MLSNLLVGHASRKFVESKIYCNTGTKILIGILPDRESPCSIKSTRVTHVDNITVVANRYLVPTRVLDFSAIKVDPKFGLAD